MNDKRYKSKRYVQIDEQYNFTIQTFVSTNHFIPSDLEDKFDPHNFFFFIWERAEVHLLLRDPVTSLCHWTTYLLEFFLSCILLNYISEDYGPVDTGSFEGT